MKPRVKRNGVWKVGNCYMIQYRHAGKTIRESARCKTRAEAVAIREARRTASRQGALVPDARKVIFDDLAALLDADAVRKGNKTRASLTRLRAAFGGQPALSITTARVDAFEAALVAEGLTRSSVNAQLAVLRHAFRLAVEKELLPRAPAVIRTPDPRNARTGFFEEEALRRVLAALPEHLRPVVEFGSLTGWRVRSEVLTLTWPQVDQRAKVIRLEPGSTKNREGREFPFGTLPALEALLNRQRATGEPYSAHHVFHRAGRPIDYKHLRLAWRRACCEARVAGMLLHDLRRTAVRNLVRAGVPDQAAMRLTGHKTRAVFDRYDIIDARDLREGVAKLAAALEPMTNTKGNWTP